VNPATLNPRGVVRVSTQTGGYPQTKGDQTFSNPSPINYVVVVIGAVDCVEKPQNP